MSLVRWDPLQLMRWPDIWDDDDMSANVGGNMDIYETEDEVVVKANVPGVKDEHVDITFEKGVLWVRAEEEQEDTSDKKFYRKASRSYSYKVAVPGNIDTSKEPEATIKGGVVSVTFSKAEEAKPKKISVKRK